MKKFTKGFRKECDMRKLSYFLNYLVNSGRCHFKTSLQIFPRIVLLHMYIGEGNAVDSTQFKK